ncbi:flagellin N-terminal helical domain-containing protein [Nitrospirillum pindoramense]
MMPVVTTNTAANSALRYLNTNSEAESSSVSKIASGSRITKASDDAAGLAVGTKIQSDVTMLNQASTNASNGQSILQAADGGMARISDILQRMESLATESVSGTVTDTERGYIDAEYQQLTDEVDSISTGTRFNSQSLLDGTGSWSSGVTFLVGTATTDTITISLTTVDSSSLGLTGSSVSTSDGATSAITTIKSAISALSTARAKVGAQISRFEYQGEMISTSIENQEAAQSAIMDVDVASEQTKLSNEDTLVQAGINALAKANQLPSELLKLLQ